MCNMIYAQKEEQCGAVRLLTDEDVSHNEIHHNMAATYGKHCIALAIKSIIESTGANSSKKEAKVTKTIKYQVKATMQSLPTQFHR